MRRFLGRRIRSQRRKSPSADTMKAHVEATAPRCIVGLEKADDFLTLRQSMAEPLESFGIGDPKTRSRRADELLSSVGVAPEMFDRKPHQLSGGECQRAVIARSLASDPRVLLLDEPMSALDPPRQAALSEVLARLTRENRRAILLISHDLTAVRRLSTRVALLDKGRIVEDVPSAEFFARPSHPVARQFLEAWPPLPFS